MTSGLLMGQGSEVRDTFGFDSGVHGGPVHEMGKWRESKVSGNVKGSVRLCWFETSIRREWQPSGMHEPGARGGILRPRDGAAPCRCCRRSGGAHRPRRVSGGHSSVGSVGGCSSHQLQLCRFSDRDTRGGRQQHFNLKHVRIWSGGWGERGTRPEMEARAARERGFG